MIFCFSVITTEKHDKKTTFYGNKKRSVNESSSQNLEWTQRIGVGMLKNIRNYS